ncbi:MAG TPA: hypothetical protein VGR06_43405 [Actinophytocola sp.]|uniref:hypothetical protein n=1 Tax=Actinophytocola sp. TaxID=1872138 RepID=UPI002E05A612|nr:hypothetical protein [Actinophytocola sp.]
MIAARMVTPGEFSAITALITFGTIAMMPVNGAQMAVARDVAALRTSGTGGELSGYLRRLAGKVGAPSPGEVLRPLDPQSAQFVCPLRVGEQFLDRACQLGGVADVDEYAGVSDYLRQRRVCCL